MGKMLLALAVLLVLWSSGGAFRAWPRFTLHRNRGAELARQLAIGDTVVGEVLDIKGSLAQPLVVFKIDSEGEDAMGVLPASGLSPTEKMAMRVGTVFKVRVEGRDGENYAVALATSRSPSSNVRQFQSPNSRPIFEHPAPQNRPARKAPRGHLLSTLRVGTPLIGTVLSTMPYAAFVKVDVYRFGKKNVTVPVDGMLLRADILLDQLRDRHAQLDMDAGAVGRLLPVGTQLQVFVKEVYKNSGRLVVSMDGSIDKDKAVAMKLARRENSHLHRQSNRLMTELSRISVGQSVVGRVKDIAKEGILVELDPLDGSADGNSDLRLTALLGTKDLPPYYAPPAELSETHRAQLLATDFQVGRVVHGAVKKVCSPEYVHPHALYQLKIMLDELGDAVHDADMEPDLKGEAEGEYSGGEDDDGSSVKELFDELRGDRDCVPVVALREFVSTEVEDLLPQAEHTELLARITSIVGAAQEVSLEVFAAVAEQVQSAVHNFVESYDGSADISDDDDDDDDDDDECDFSDLAEPEKRSLPKSAPLKPSGVDREDGFLRDLFASLKGTSPHLDCRLALERVYGSVVARTGGALGVEALVDLIHQVQADHRSPPRGSILPRTAPSFAKIVHFYDFDPRKHLVVKQTRRSKVTTSDSAFAAASGGWLFDDQLTCDEFVDFMARVDDAVHACETASAPAEWAAFVALRSQGHDRVPLDRLRVWAPALFAQFAGAITTSTWNLILKGHVSGASFDEFLTIAATLRDAVRSCTGSDPLAQSGVQPHADVGDFPSTASARRAVALQAPEVSKSLLPQPHWDDLAAPRTRQPAPVPTAKKIVAEDLPPEEVDLGVDDSSLQQAFAELQGRNGMVTTDAFRRWQEVQLLLDSGALTAAALTEALVDVMGARHKPKDCMTYHQFVRAFNLLSDSVDVDKLDLFVRAEDEEDEEDEHEESEDSTDSIHAQDDEDDGYEYVSEAEQIFNSLGGDAHKPITARQLADWEEIRDLTSRGALSRDALAAALSSVGIAAHTPIDLELFKAAVRAIDQQVDESRLPSSPVREPEREDRGGDEDEDEYSDEDEYGGESVFDEEEVRAMFAKLAKGKSTVPAKVVRRSKDLMDLVETGFLSKAQLEECVAQLPAEVSYEDYSLLLQRINEMPFGDEEGQGKDEDEDE